MTQPQQIVFFDRYQNQTRSEQIYGEKYLRWTYETPLGKLALNALDKRTWISRWYGWRMDRPASRSKIQPFIDEYRVAPTEFVTAPQESESFNAFFSRTLQPSATPVHPEPQAIVFPADGRHLCVPNLSQCQGLFVKGQMFDLASLLQDKPLAAEFSGGSLLLSRLCPVEYHRFHFPAPRRAGPPPRWLRSRFRGCRCQTYRRRCRRRDTNRPSPALRAR